MIYNKLVRDKIPDIIAQNGDKAVVHTAGDEEYWQKLREKLVEEAQEFLVDGSQAEFADVLEVIEAIYQFKQFDKLGIETLQEEKRTKRGSFSKRIILDEA